MTVDELNRDQLTIVKQNWYMQYLDEKDGSCPSWGELADIDKIVSDDFIKEEYGGTDFVKDDFLD